jgi:hypothetical protein
MTALRLRDGNGRCVRYQRAIEYLYLDTFIFRTLLPRTSIRNEGMIVRDVAEHAA